MPMYEYKCANCGKRFEKLQKFSDEPLTVHEECGSGPVERLISAPALQFKGTGWYVTDYAKGNGGGSDKHDSSDPAKSKSSSSEGSKSESSKSEGSKSESSKSEGSKSESSSGSKSDSGGSSSPAPAGKSGSDS